MKTLTPFACLAAAIALSACADNPSMTPGGARFEDPDFGASNRNNIAAQSVPADPAAANAPVEAVGAFASQAQSRYLLDKMKEPPDPQTSSVGTSGSGGASAAASGGGK